MPRPVPVYVSVGSNVDRERHVRGAVAGLRRRYGPCRLSSVYETEAVGFRGAPFYNLAVGFRTTEPVEAVAASLRELEAAAGRRREGPRFGPRTLDLDLLLYGGLVREGPGLRLPRPEILEQAFVLAPLAELAPALVHPLAGRTLAELWEAMRPGAPPMRRVALPGL
ncbi:MAG: 2-amino-4-hydroxy-6-hydroxymethyldihydropteridine diphosphokinase [Gammaproteobacteria bacterium]|nr:MAG: 2-amino-4-hydroxy-6-hydroxymethyldihydropteridine diphosphokinase [Gammaproteobacteria bacterium]